MVRPAFLVAMLALMTVFAVRAIDPPLQQYLRNIGFDITIGLLGLIDPIQPDVVVIDIDEESLTRHGQWPWPRMMMAELTRGINTARPRAIGFDIMFVEADRMSPQAMAQALGDYAPDVAARAAEMPDSDAVFADALAEAPVVLGDAIFGRSSAAGSVLAVAPSLQVAGDNPAEFLPSASSRVRNIAVLEAVAVGSGYLSVPQDRDGVIRRLPLVARSGPMVLPGFPLEIMRVALGVEQVELRTDGYWGVSAVQIGDRVINTGANGSIWLRPGPIATERRLPAWAVLAGDYDPARLDDRIVIIGSTAQGLADVGTSSHGPAVPGVELMAQSIDALMSDTYLSRPPQVVMAEFGITLLLGLALVMTLPRMRARRQLGVGIGVIAAIAVVGFGIAYLSDLLVDVSFPIAATVAVAIVIGYASYRREERDRDATLKVNRLMRDIMQNTFDAIVATDSDGWLMTYNQAAADLFGLKPSGERPTPLSDLLIDPRLDAPDPKKPLAVHLVEAGGIQTLDGRRRSGQTFEADVAVSTLYHDRDHVFAFVIRDVTARRTAEAAARRANAAKSEFLTMMSHELRTPLNAVIGFSEIIQSAPYGPLGDSRYQSYVDDIHNSGQHLLEVIETILEVVEIDAHSLRDESEAFDVLPILKEVCAEHQDKAKAKSIALSLAGDSDLPPLVGDSGLLRKIIDGLVANAVRFTPPRGTILIVPRREKRLGLSISVADASSDFDESELDSVVLPPHDQGSRLDERNSGVCLDLPIAKLATEKHGGRLWIRSNRGRGTIVHAIFPAVAPEDDAHPHDNGRDQA